MLAIAREARGMSQTELANRIGRSAGYINKAERGLIAVPAEQIEALSDALRFPVSFLLSDDHLRTYDSPCLYYRKRKTLPVRRLAQLEAKMHALVHQLKWLFQGVDIEPAYDFHTVDPDEYGGPEGAARALRRAWGRPRGPIKNMTEIVEAAGAIVVLDDFGTAKLDGMSCWAKGLPPFFYLNSEVPTEVLRFTLAHELGHLVMHMQPTPDPEGEADAFAAEFLMPELEIRPQLANLQMAKLGPLKQYWGITMRNLITRASRLNVITEGRRRSLYVQLSQKGQLGFNEPYPLPPEVPATVEAAIQVHLRQHKFAVGEIIDIARMDRSDWVGLFGAHDSARRLRAVKD